MRRLALALALLLTLSAAALALGEDNTSAQGNDTQGNTTAEQNDTTGNDTDTGDGNATEDGNDSSPLPPRENSIPWTSVGVGVVAFVASIVIARET